MRFQGVPGKMTGIDFRLRHKTWAEIDLSALRRNYTATAEYAGDARVMCVVKADAYGHGAVACSEVFYEAGARWFAVSSVEEAAEICLAFEAEGRGDAKILILGYTPPENAPFLAMHKIRQAVFSLEYARALSAEAVAAGCRVIVHFKLDTGMNRLGFDARNTSSAEKTADEILGASALPGLLPEGLFTHFACADGDDGSITETQFGNYKAVEDALSSGGLRLLRHVCNSAATVRRPDLHLDMVRAGIILYGLDPWTPYDGGLRLLPVMKFKSTVSHIHTVRKGEGVGYGLTYTAPRDSKIVTVPVGYADGFVRAFGAGGMLSVNGRRAPIVGRICMDQCMADAGDAEVSVGDEVVIFGGEPGQINELADVARTINYELVCLVGKRVPRIYKG